MCSRCYELDLQLSRQLVLEVCPVVDTCGLVRLLTLSIELCTISHMPSHDLSAAVRNVCCQGAEPICCQAPQSGFICRSVGGLHMCKIMLSSLCASASPQMCAARVPAPLHCWAPRHHLRSIRESRTWHSKRHEGKWHIVTFGRVNDSLEHIQARCCANDSKIQTGNLPDSNSED